MTKRKNVYRLELVEPTFVLRASDPLAPSLIRQWARRRELAIAKGQMPNADPDDVERARQLALDMDKWAQQDVITKFSKRFPDGRTSGEVIKLKRPE